MPTDLLIIALSVALGIFILHIKSHIKFILLGLYIGVVLAETVGLSIYQYLGDKLPAITSPGGYNIMQLVLLLIPTLAMGFNHSQDKKKWSLGKKIIFVSLTALILVSGILQYLPDGIRQTVVGNSLVAFRIHQLYIPLLIMGAALLVVESFHHKKLSKITP